MKDFSELKIKIESKRFVGDKIKINKVVGKKIIVHAFKIKPSKFEDAGNCLTLQIEIENEKRVIFTRGSALIDVLIQADPINDLPFKTTIVRDDDNGPYEFRSGNI
jgi:hypothetical protein